jgi:hypothetical protein
LIFVSNFAFSFSFPFPSQFSLLTAIIIYSS